MEKKFTPGPWEWGGNANSNYVRLATTHSGKVFVMDFVRWGMQGAQPRFQPDRKMGMRDAKDLLQFAVGDQSIVGVDTARKDASVYRYDVRGIDCPDARLIAAAPCLFDALEQCAESLEACAARLGIQVESALPKSDNVVPGVFEALQAARTAIAKALGQN